MRENLRAYKYMNRDFVEAALNRGRFRIAHLSWFVNMDSKGGLIADPDEGYCDIDYRNVVFEHNDPSARALSKGVPGIAVTGAFDRASISNSKVSGGYLPNVYIMSFCLDHPNECLRNEPGYDAVIEVASLQYLARRLCERYPKRLGKHWSIARISYGDPVPQPDGDLIIQYWKSPIYAGQNEIRIAWPALSSDLEFFTECPDLGELLRPLKP